MPVGHRAAALLLALGLAGAGAGCGGAHRGDQATPPQVPVSAKDKQELQALHRQVTRSLKQTSGQAYGGLPAYLASRQGDPNRILLATAGHPARTTQGAHVHVRLASGRATAIAIGPIIPLKLEGTDQRLAPAQFTLTFTGLHGDVPLRSEMFGVLDEHGALHIPPAHVTRRGSSAKVDVRLILPTGDGKLVYSPAGKPLVTWDYTLETD